MPKLDLTAPLAKQFESLVNEQGELDLMECELSTVAVDVLVQAFSQIPAKATALLLNGNKLASTRSSADLCQILKAIPAHITELDLNGNDLGKLNGNDLYQVFTSIPPKLSKLSLSQNQLSELRNGSLMRGFLAISRHDHLDALDLSGNDLGALPDDELAGAFSALPKTLRRLNLSENGLERLSAEKLGAALSRIPAASVDFIKLAYNKLGQYTGTELAEIFKLLGDRNIQVGLSKTGLGRKLAQELAIAFAALRPRQVLDLSLNDLGFCENLAVAFAAIPAGAQDWNLSRNMLGFLESKGALARALDAAKGKGVTNLNLSFNFLNKLSIAELSAVLAAVPASVTTINLSYNWLEAVTISPADSVEILSKLPDTVSRFEGIPLNCDSLKEAHGRLLQLTRQYRDQDLHADRKDPALTQRKRDFFDGLLTELGKVTEEKDKYKAMKAFVGLLNDKGKDNACLNEHRDPQYKRYLANILSVLTLIPALYRAYQSHQRFGTFRFWQSTSEKLKGVALREGETMRIASRGG